MMNQQESKIELRDVIEEGVEIMASPQQVWKTISTPGWWLGDYSPESMHFQSGEGGPSVTVNDEFRVETLVVDELQHVSFKWTWIQDSLRPVTVVDCSIYPISTGTFLHVRESGLSVGESAPLLLEHYGQNVEGWREQLGLVKETSETK